MAEVPKRRTVPSQEDASRVSKPDRPSGSAAAETGRAADSVPAPIGPFATLPMRFGRYEIRKELGRGQMGAVYLAKDIELDRFVALKVARVSASGSAKILKRMEVEAKSAAKIDHPLICKVYDAGEIDGIRFIALQYIEGEDLKQYMKRVGRKRSPDEAVQLVLQILRALEAAHAQGVIHRDLKPENVMLNKNREPVIMDFGLARQTIASSNAGLTQGMIVGTAAYMSPEQATGRAEGIDHRSDLYAVGVMLFEMLTGEWPFAGGAIEIMGKKCVLEPPSVLTMNPNLNSQLANVCDKMLAKQKGDRFVTCSEAIKALEAVDVNSPPVIIEEGAVSSPKKTGVDVQGLGALQRNVTNIKSGTSEPVFDFPSTPPVVVAPRKISKISKAKKDSRHKLFSNVAASITGYWNSIDRVFRLSAIGAGVVGLIVLFAIFFWPKPNGLIQFDIEDPTLSVRFNESTITTENDGRPIRVAPTLKHKFVILQNGVEIESVVREINLTNGESRTIKVTSKDGVPMIDGDAIISKSITSKSTGMKMDLIPAGTFLMGSPDTESEGRPDERPQHSVVISQPFYLGVYEVTQGEYEKVMGQNPSSFSRGGIERNRAFGQDTSRFPVERVSWYDAVDFCNRLSERDGLSAFYRLTNVIRENDSLKSATVSTQNGNGYRLPTEAEWEYACRANTVTPFNTGSVLEGHIANIDGNLPYGTLEKGRYLKQPITVGSYENSMNSFGLFDMHGNVREWCFDVYNPIAYSNREDTSHDSIVVSDSSARVLRGGSWYVSASASRSAFRYYQTPGTVSDHVGFRVARNVMSASIDASKLKPTAKLKIADSTAIRQVPDNGQNSIFNGKDLSGWDGLPGYWHVENGMLIGRVLSGQNAHTFLVSKKTYTDFDLQFDVRRERGVGNSGVQFRSSISDPKTFGMIGPQCEIDSANFRFLPGSLVTEPTGKPLAVNARIEVKAPYKDADFNHFQIRCVGQHVTIKVNEFVAVDGEYPISSLPAEGHIGWQIHGTRPVSEIIFKNIQLIDLAGSNKPLAPADAMTFRNKHFKLFNEHLTWHEAKAKCQQMGGRLAEVRLKEENDFLTNLVHGHGSDGIWLGATDEYSYGQWRWSNGSELAYTNWDRSQPNNAGGGEHYIMLLVRDKLGKWWDQPNISGLGLPKNWKTGFVCEWDLVLPTKPSTDIWKSVFNGKDLSGWTATKGGWVVHDGDLVCETNVPGWLQLDNVYGDCEIYFEFLLPPKTNSGLALRYSGKGNAFGKNLVEIQLENDSTQTRLDQKCGGICGIIPPVMQAFKNGQWNVINVRQQSGRISVRLNDQLVVNATANENAVLHSLPAVGHFCLQNCENSAGRGNGCRFRNIRIAEFASESASTVRNSGK